MNVMTWPSLPLISAAPCNPSASVAPGTFAGSSGRLWKALDVGQEQRPVWLGAATFDRSVGVSRYTGAITHHIGPDIDAERTLLADNLEAAAMVDAKYQVTGIGPTFDGRNGGGDLYYTDGEIWVLRLVEACSKNHGTVAQIPSPAATEFKDQIWRAVVESIGK